MIRRRGRKNESGAVALEFALVFPIFVLLMFAIIQYGLRFWATNTGAATAREAARLMVVNTNWTCTSNWVKKQSGRAALGDVEVTLTNTTTGTAISTASVIPEGTPITVTVSFDAFDLGMGLVPGERVVETANATVQYEPRAALGSVSPQACPADYL